MKKLATVIAAIALIGTPAFAADMAVKVPPKPVAPAPLQLDGVLRRGKRRLWMERSDCNVYAQRRRCELRDVRIRHLRATRVF
jgi:hypothetical protein